MITRIRDVRRTRGLTLADVASRCTPPTTAQTIGRLETGTRTVSMGWLQRIASALEVDPAELVTLTTRTDLPVAAILGADGVEAPARPLTLAPPAPGPGQIAIRVEASQGDYRAGDVIWADQLSPDAFASALHRDVLTPRPVGRFAFGRLLEAGEAAVTLLPGTPGGRPLTVTSPPWLAVARLVVRAL